MVLNTLTVSAAVTPAVVETCVSHYLNRKQLRQKPTSHISYHEGLVLVRKFLHFASTHTVEELQAFTSQWVPVPHWVKAEGVEIPQDKISKAADLLQAQLGPAGIEQIGGKTWWQWRRENSPLKAEWIEMRKDYQRRKKKGDKCGQRIMLYIHGGAYYFGSVDEHRYQMQRHARKLQARVFAPRYRLAPQFPFPCGLQDCLAAYLQLLEDHDPSTILVAGDSAGGGMALSLLVTVRDQGLPLPAGAILLSPWVDLTHSFPSLSGDGALDYIPAHGFVHKPSIDWPPPNSDDLEALAAGLIKPAKEATNSQKANYGQKKEADDAAIGFTVTNVENLTPSSGDGKQIDPGSNSSTVENRKPSPNKPLSIVIDDNLVEIKDQIQMYAANHILTHPLVSPVLQPTLGGLPPLLIQVGGGELLKDEQIYLAHKAASPLSYLPSASAHLSIEFIKSEAAKYPPTDVQLQIWDDLCHVAPTLSFTRPAKYMYRSIAQFGAWALARAQKAPIEILDDDDISIISTSSSSSGDSSASDTIKSGKLEESSPSTSDGMQHLKATAVGRAGDALPPFQDHMIRQRIDRHGMIYPLPHPSSITCLQLPDSDIGVIKQGPVRKWMKAQKDSSERFAKDKRAVQKKRLEHMKLGFEGFDGETPPPTALAGRRVKGMTYEQRKKRSWGMSIWSLWGSKHDVMTIKREDKADGTAPGTSPTSGPPASGDTTNYGSVKDEGQTDTISVQSNLGQVHPKNNDVSPQAIPSVAVSPPEEGYIISATSETVIPDSNTNSTRPTRDGIAYPFKLVLGNKNGQEVNASTMTLTSVMSTENQDEHVEDSINASNKIDKRHDSAEDENQRPQPERFYTAQEL